MYYLIHKSLFENSRIIAFFEFIKSSKGVGTVMTYKPNYNLILGSQDKHSFIDSTKNPPKFTEKIVISEDALTALYFAVEARTKCEDAVVYVVAIENKKIKYYDSDTVSVIANLAKSPLGSSHDKDVKSKYAIAKDAKNASERRDRISNYNECESTKFLLHDIKEDKGYFSNLIDPKHIFSIQFVKPKLTNTRIYGQKGAFLLFGLNIDNVEKHIPIIEYNNKKPYLLDNVLIQHPIKKILKIKINCSINLEELRKIGITKPYIYTGLDKISEHLKDIYK